VLIIEVFADGDDDDDHAGTTSGQKQRSSVSRNVLPFVPPKLMRMPATSAAAPVLATVSDTPNSADGNLSVNITLRASTLTTSLFVVLTTQAPGRFSDNVMLIETGQSVLVEFISWDGPLNSTGMDLLKGSHRVEHLAENM